MFLVIWYRWVHFEKVIDDLVAQAIYYRSLEQLQTHAKEFYIEDEEEFNTMVNFYHDLGMIVKHRETVVLKAQWLIDLFKQVITIPHFEKMVRNAYFTCARTFFLVIYENGVSLGLISFAMMTAKTDPS